MLATGDSGQNTAECTNSAIGDALVDGGTVNWETHKKFDGLTDDMIASVSVADFDRLEEARMEKNAWAVAHELSSQIDDAPATGGPFLECYVTDPPEDMFLFNKAELLGYSRAPAAVQRNLPGAAYFRKIFSYIQDHYQAGELYFEFLCGECRITTGQLCDSCTKCPSVSKGAENNRIPRPAPDGSKLPDYHYLDVFMTPVKVDDGRWQVADDWQPRANFRQLFHAGAIALESRAMIFEFCQKFIVAEEVVWST